MATEILNFETEVEHLLDDSLLVGPQDGVFIQGSNFEAGKLELFLNTWELSGLPYRIWEYTDHIEFTRKEGLPETADHPWLERGRLFGERGDLHLRRDNDCFSWHFIGAFDPSLDPGIWEVRDFWAAHPDVRLRRTSDTALLWGQHRGQTGDGRDYWQDDRVGWADLTYPHPPADSNKSKRVEIHYTAFTANDQIAFVWWKGLRDHG